MARIAIALVLAVAGCATAGSLPGLYVSYREVGELVVLDPDSGRIRAKVALPARGSLFGGILSPDPGAIAFSPSGRHAYVACPNIGAVAVVDVVEERLVALPRIDGAPTEAAPSPDGRRLYVANGSDAIAVVDTSTWAVAAHLDVGAGTAALALSRDGRRLYATTRDHELVAIDAEAMSVVGRLDVGTAPADLALSPSGGHAFISLARAPAGSIGVVDLESLALEKSIGVGASPGPLALAPDGESLFVLNTESDTISVVELDRLEVARTFVVARDAIDLAVSPAGDEIFLAQPDADVITVIDVDGNPRRELGSHPPWPASPWRLAILPTAPVSAPIARPTP